jgi:hypothetical protein
MEAPNRPLPAVAAVVIITLLVLLSIGGYLLLSGN